MNDPLARRIHLPEPWAYSVSACKGSCYACYIVLLVAAACWSLPIAESI